MYDFRHSQNLKTTFKQCFLNGEWVQFDAQTSKPLEYGKKVYENFTYIGSGTRTKIDGVEQSDTTTEKHFFILTSKL